MTQEGEPNKAMFHKTENPNSSSQNAVEVVHRKERLYEFKKTNESHGKVNIGEKDCFSGSWPLITSEASRETVPTRHEANGLLKRTYCPLFLPSSSSHVVHSPQQVQEVFRVIQGYVAWRDCALEVDAEEEGWRATWAHLSSDGLVCYPHQYVSHSVDSRYLLQPTSKMIDWTLSSPRYLFFLSVQSTTEEI